MKHNDSLRRILFIYAKLNPGIRYVQGCSSLLKSLIIVGMNEIVAPIYYVFAKDAADDTGLEVPLLCVTLLELMNAEADTFFCFTNIMSEIMDNFIRSLDSSEIGVHKTLGKLYALLQHLDEPVPRNWIFYT